MSVCVFSHEKQETEEVVQLQEGRSLSSCNPESKRSVSLSEHKISDAKNDKEWKNVECISCIVASEETPPLTSVFLFLIALPRCSVTDLKLVARCVAGETVGTEEQTAVTITGVPQAAFAEHNVQYQFRTENSGGQVSRRWFLNFFHTSQFSRNLNSTNNKPQTPKASP